jgi:hypothetical protein
MKATVFAGVAIFESWKVFGSKLAKARKFETGFQWRIQLSRSQSTNNDQQGCS